MDIICLNIRVSAGPFWSGHTKVEVSRCFHYYHNGNLRQVVVNSHDSRTVTATTSEFGRDDRKKTYTHKGFLILWSRRTPSHLIKKFADGARSWGEELEDASSDDEGFRNELQYQINAIYKASDDLRTVSSVMRSGSFEFRELSYAFVLFVEQLEGVWYQFGTDNSGTFKVDFEEEEDGNYQRSYTYFNITKIN